jgi:hypothetical protein
MEYNYLIKAAGGNAAKLSVTPWDTTVTSHTSIDGFKDVAAIVVTIAVLDSRSRVIIRDYTKLTGSSVFSDAADGTDTATTWNQALKSSGFASSAGIPPQAASAVRIYQRYYYLNKL